MTAILLLLIGVAPPMRPQAVGPTRNVRSVRASGGLVEPDIGESEAIQERIQDYLKRHGDRGRIDPERQRRRVAQEYQRFRREAAARVPGSSSLGIGGSEWISIGPTNGAGRMTAIAPVPGAPNTVYAGAAGGGVWKTTDGGLTWLPLTEGLHDLSVGAIAVAPSNPSIIYVGSGEGGYIESFIPGIGLVKSVDGGANWILPESVVATTFYRISVHPTDANELVAGTNGGGFRSTDGGAHWSNVISHAEYGDVADLVRDPMNPKVLYATTWCALRDCTFLSAHVLRSEDGGVTWSDRSAGLPTNGLGVFERTSIAIASSDPRILYAARGVQEFFGRLGVRSHIYKTTDGGLTWNDLSSLANDLSTSHYLGVQAFYDNALVVSPTDANSVLAGGVNYVRSTDGGASFSRAFTDSVTHVDCHDLRYHGSRLWIANDGGVETSDDGGVTSTARNTGLVTRQFYALAIDPVNRDRVIAGSQDNGTVQRLDSSTLWRNIDGGDGFGCAIHPLSPEIAWSSVQFGEIWRMRDAGSATKPSREKVSPPFESDESGSFHSLIRLDPREGNTIYSASTRLWASRDGGETWRPFPTATTDGSDWSVFDDIRAIALPSRDSPLLIIAKGNVVFQSADRGATWTAGRGLPDAVVTNVEIDPGDPSRAYATIATTTGPSLYRSDDGGLNWTASAAGLPAFAAQVLRVDPTDSTDLFCGTDVGVFHSTDRGASWARFGVGLPSASIHDVQVLDDGSLLRAATYGRGIWELQVPSSGNNPPFARIVSPDGSLDVAVGASIDFDGEVGDLDAGDSATGTWFFPDDGAAISVAPAGSPVQHTFRRSGIFPVALAARDSHGARSSATVTISVREAADACATPVVIPGAGPFPYTRGWNDAAGSKEPSDPLSFCQPGSAAPGSTWLEFTPAVTGIYTFSTCTDVNTTVSIYTGPACGPYSPVPIVCGTIGAPGSDCGIGTTSLDVTLTAGQTLRVLLAGVVEENVGPVRLTISLPGTSSNALRVDRLDRMRGPVGGGTLVVINGRGFGNGASVLFGGVPATDVAVLGANAITARTPPHAAGPVDVSVTIPGAGTGALGNGFHYETPESANRSAVGPAKRRPPVRTLPPR